MAIYDKTGTNINTVYALSGGVLSHAYDINGNDLLDGEEPFVKTTLSYDTNWLITSAWLANATTQRNAVKALYQQSSDAIPFFIQTDGHGRFNEGNKGCHNLAEEVMRYIPNMQLGDYASYYYDGANPSDHARTSAGITNYLPAMGNHEFLNNNSEDAELADLPTLIASYTPSNGILGSQTYGYYKVYDVKHNIKWLVGQPHIPDANNSSGFVTKMTSDQWQWFIDEMEEDDGYDVIVLNHEPFSGTYYRVATEDTATYTGGNYNLSPILEARKAKTSGTFTDPDGITHSYDFSDVSSDLLAVFHGHTHKVMYLKKTQHGYPVFVGRDFTNAGDCCYGLIDRANGKLYIYCFTNSEVSEPIILDL